MSHRSQTEQARGAWGRDTKTGRGKKAGGDRARNTKQEVNRAGFEAQGTEPSGEMHRGVWGNLFSDTLSPHFSPLGQKHQGQAQKTFPNPITTNYKSGAGTLCCKPITLFSQPPTPTPDNTHRALYTSLFIILPAIPPLDHLNSPWIAGTTTEIITKNTTIVTVGSNHVPNSTGKTQLQL